MDKAKTYQMFAKGFFFAFLFALHLYVIHELTFTELDTTIVQHGRMAIDDLDGDLHHVHKGFFHALNFIHLITRISYEYSMMYLLGTILTLTSIAIFKSLKLMLGNTFHEIFYLLMSGVLSFVSGIYVPFFSEFIYLGHGSPNLWHNATFIMVKFFAIVSFYVIMRFYGDEKLRNNIGYLIWMAVSILLTIYMKPTFAMIFIPAVSIYVLANRLKETDYIWKTAVVVLPSVLIMGIMYFLFYGQADPNDPYEGRSLGFEFLSVWRYWTPSIFGSFLLVFAFPLYILIVRFKQALNDKYQFVTWLMVLFGMALFALVAEKNADGEMVKFSYYMNWIGGYLISMIFAFINSFAELMRWTNEEENPEANIKIWVAVSLLALHTMSGIFHFLKIIDIKLLV